MLTPADFGPLHTAYLHALQTGSGRGADQVVQQALDAQHSAAAIYLGLFQPAAYTLGRLWQRNELSVAQEHLATAIIERQMGALHPYFQPQQTRPQTVVLGCVDQEYHRIGAHMVADFFEQDGWTVHYLGASVPTPTFIALARERRADLIGLSSQMVYHVPAIGEFVRELDRQGLGGLPIMAGGLPFIQQPALYKTLGVTFTALDARAAVQQANTLV